MYYYCKNGMTSGKSTSILANMKSPLFILGIYMVFSIISILEKFNVNLQSKTITVSLMISYSNFFFPKLQKCREEIIFSDIIDLVNKCIDDNDIDDLVLPRKIKRKDNNQHITIEELYRRDYYRIIDMAIESIHTYFNATDINIYKEMEQIFTNTEHNIDIIKDYTELCKEDLIAEIRCYTKCYNNMNLNNIIKKYKLFLRSNKIVSINSNPIKIT